MRKPDRLSPGATVRCAIYTRKSSEEGLEQEFNSLDAQREACEAYILSQKHEGWVCPAADCTTMAASPAAPWSGRRCSACSPTSEPARSTSSSSTRSTGSPVRWPTSPRSSRCFDAHDVSFVSVTQQFNTTTSMGRLTLNMLLSFAQFEREITGERIRDKIAASKSKGMWMGGNVPLGYDVKDRKLVVNEAEAETVRLIFRRYAELGSVRLLQRGTRPEGNREQDAATGAGGVPSRWPSLLPWRALHLLQNRIYRGEIVHQGMSTPVSTRRSSIPTLWQIVQDKLAANRHERSLGAGARRRACLPA